LQIIVAGGAISLYERFSSTFSRFLIIIIFFFCSTGTGTGRGRGCVVFLHSLTFSHECVEHACPCSCVFSVSEFVEPTTTVFFGFILIFFFFYSYRLLLFLLLFSVNQ